MSQSVSDLLAWIKFSNDSMTYNLSSSNAKWNGGIVRPKWLFLMGIIVAMHTTPSLAEDVAFKAYHDSAGEVVQLSSQASDPFLFLGKQVEAGHPLAEKYAKSLQKFPDVQSCLVKVERGKLQPDLTLFDWDQLQNNEDAEVCLFRVASSYSTMEAMHQWFQIHGFKSTLHKATEMSDPGITASISLDKQWPKVSANIFAKLWIKLTAYGQTISISYDTEGNVQSTDAGYSSL